MPKKSENKWAGNLPPMPDTFSRALMDVFRPLLYDLIGDGSKKRSVESLRIAFEEADIAQRVTAGLELPKALCTPEFHKKLTEHFIGVVRELLSDPEELESYNYCRIHNTVLPNDPYLQQLKNIPASEKCYSGASLPDVDTLRFLHIQALTRPNKIHPLDAQNAMLIAGALKIPAPEWAVNTLRIIQQSKVRDRKVDLDKEFGYVAEGSGKTCEVESRLRSTIEDESMLRVWGLLSLGKSLRDACWLEAGRRQNLDYWNQTDYDIAPDLGSRKKNDADRHRELHDKRCNFSEVLRKQWFKWRTEIEQDPNSPESTYFAQLLAKYRDTFLSQFPSS
jgi:hypothetical protein